MILSVLTYQTEAQCVLHVLFVDEDPLLNITSKSIMMAALCSGSMARLHCCAFILVCIGVLHVLYKLPDT